MDHMRDDQQETVVTLEDVQTKIMARLDEVGACGAAPPFALRRKADKQLLDEALKRLLDTGAVRAIDRSCYVNADVTLPSDVQVLSALRLAKRAGRTAKSLGDRLHVAAALLEPMLTRLVDEHALMIHWRGIHAFYFLPEFSPPTVEGLADQIAERLRADPGCIFDLRDLKRHQRRPAVKALVEEAMAWLEAEGRARRVEHCSLKGGHLHRKSYWLAAQEELEITPNIPHVSASSSPLPWYEDDIKVGERVRDAYTMLRLQSGLPFVDILDLQQRSQVPLETLHRWLLDGLQRGTAQATGTNLAAVDAAHQRAAITWRGYRCLPIKLIAL